MLQILFFLIYSTAFFNCSSIKDFYTIEKDFENIREKLHLTVYPNDLAEGIAEKMTSSNDCSSRKNFKGPDVFQFVPILKGIIKGNYQVASFSNNCFQDNVITMEKVSNDTIKIRFSAHNATSYFCKDSYVFSTSRINLIKVVVLRGIREMTISNLSEDDFIDIRVNGIRIISFCDDLISAVISFYKTIKFIKSDYQNHTEPIEVIEKENVDFLKKFGNITMENRGAYGNDILPVENEIQTGDFFGSAHVSSSVSTLIMYLTAGRVSHAAIALRENNQLYVAEMVFKGMFLTPYQEWIEKKHREGFQILYLPLKKEFRNKFNTTKALDFVRASSKLYYGTYNMFFSWLDLPKGNFPEFMSTETLMLFLSLLEKFNRGASDANFVTGLNMRLNTRNLTIHQVAVEAARRNLTFEELGALPEKDEWRYDNGENFICSAFVTEIYKQAGVFGSIIFNSKEFTQQDIYQLAIFDNENKEKRPQICKEADPSLDYCQIIGRYRINLNDWGTIKPYDHMNERCPTYEKVVGC